MKAEEGPVSPDQPNLQWNKEEQVFNFSYRVIE
jgi:hypothetical protein